LEESDELEELDESDESLLLALFEVFDVFELPELLAALAPDEFDAFFAAELSVTDACVDPGSTVSTTPAATTEAKDTPTVVALRRRLPCSRSATARAIRCPAV